MENWYRILGITYDAGPGEVKKAFRALAKKFHPDVSDDPGAQFRLIHKAYKILSEPKLRLAYNKKLFRYHILKGKKLDSRRVEYSSMAKLAREGLLRRGAKKKRRSRIGYDMQVSMTREEASEGVLVEVTVPVKEYCPYCLGSDRHCFNCAGMGSRRKMGSVHVRIPAGSRHGSVLRVEIKKRARKNIFYCMREIRIRINLLKESVV